MVQVQWGKKQNLREWEGALWSLEGKWGGMQLFCHWL